MINYLRQIGKTNFFIDSFVILFLSHIYYKITYVEWLESDFNLIFQIRENNLTSTIFSIESPTYTLLGLILKIDNIDNYKLLIYFITLFGFLIIIINTHFLGGYSTLFLFGGWLVTCSWYLGYVDIVSVVLITIISRHVIENNVQIVKNILYFTLLTINHSALAFAYIIILGILANRKSQIKFIWSSISALVIGNIILRIYLNYIGFSGRGRLRFVFNDNIIENATTFLGNNILIVLWSGFLGVSFSFLLLPNVLQWLKVQKIIIATFVALFFTSISLDTSRVFSLLIVPVLLTVLKSLQEEPELKSRQSLIYTISILLFFVVGTYHFLGEVWIYSPMVNSESFYDLITRFVNSLMSDIWK
jgi:hypothetical protein